MEDEGELSISRRRRRWPRVLGAIALLLGLALLGLWLARKPIARGEADRFLAQAGVPARYTISDLGFGRQRLSGVVLGDPARPDLVADWLETRTVWGLHGPHLAEVRGGHVRVRARWADGRMSLGSIDRLLPPGKGKGPFALPALALDVQDLRARVETPWGVVGAKLSGHGRLDGGFAGTLAVVSDRLGETGCTVDHPAGLWRVRTVRSGLFGAAQRVVLEGSTQVSGLACGGGRAGFANTDGAVAIALGDAVRWTAKLDVAATALRAADASARRVAGRVELTGRGGALNGTVALTAAQVAAAQLRAEQVAANGAVRHDPGHKIAFAYDGALRWSGARVPPAAVPQLAGMGQGTPVGPLAQRLDAALGAAAARFGGAAAVSLTTGPERTVARLSKLTLASASGARTSFGGGAGASWSPRSGLLLDGTPRLAGGGFPDLTVRLDRRSSGAFSGTAEVAPYAADGARLALAPVRFASAGGEWRVATEAKLSGPLAGGRVDGLTLPVDARWRNGSLTLAPGCAPVRWEGVAVASLRLDPGAVRLCPTGEALATLRGARLGGGARLGATRLTGRIGSTPVALAVAGARFALADSRFALTGVEARLGLPERATELRAASLSGAISGGGAGGSFAGAGGRIGAVPLVMNDAAGEWRLAGGALSVGGALRVTDAATPSRFQPLAARDVTLLLASNRITAAGALHEPTTGTKVADVVLQHDLAAGAGAADLTVAGLTFDKGFQPERLTRLTYGVIADVRGTVSGEGHIAWSPAGVTSTGRFRTRDMDLAAAFGPVQGLAGEIRFTDLLQLQSAPGQRVTVKSINPGIPVTDGVVTFQTLPGARVRVEGARWPFAGGTLVLEPTLLDFSGPAERRLTFRVSGAEADRFLQSLDFKNLNATGTFDGVLPMVFDASGGRIENGRLTVRSGGGTIAYVGPVSQKDLGFWGDFAFEALKSLRYRSLGILMNGSLAGEMVTEVRFAGVTQGAGAKSNFLIRRLQRLPIVFNIRIRAPFRGLLDATASFYDPKRLNLPELLERQDRQDTEKAVQPPASETVP